MKSLILTLTVFSAQTIGSGAAAAALTGNLNCSVEATGQFADAPLGWFDTCIAAPVVSVTELRVADAKLVYSRQAEIDAYSAARSYAGVKTNYGRVEIYATSEVRMNEYGYAEAKAQAWGTFSDSVTVLSNTLSSGSKTLIELRYELDVLTHSKLISSTPAIGRFSYDMQSYFLFGPGLARADLNNTWNSQFGEIHYDGYIFVDSKYIHQEIVEVKVGDSFDVSASLFGQVASYGNLPFNAGSSYLAYSDINASFFAGKGITLYLSPVNSDVTLLSESGHSYGYATAVPEPAIYLILISGLLALLVAQKRRAYCQVD